MSFLIGYFFYLEDVLGPFERAILLGIVLGTIIVFVGRYVLSQPANKD